MKSIPLLTAAALLFSYTPAPSLAAAASPMLQCPPAPPPPPPPPGGGGSGGSGRPPGAGSTPVGPVSPGPSVPAPASPGPASSPGAGIGPAAGPASSPPPLSAPAPATGSAYSPPSIGTKQNDTLHWSHWWYLESARFLDVRRHIQGPPTPDGRSIVSTAPRAPTRRFVEAEVVPRLIEIAREERSVPMVAAALVSLGRAADAPSELHGSAVEAVHSHLGSSSAQIRESAIIALGLFGTPKCNDTLLALAAGGKRAEQFALTASVSTRTRAFAAHALGLSAVRIDNAHEQQRIALAMIDLLEGDVLGMADLPVAAVSTLGLVTLPERLLVPVEAHRDRDHVDHVLSSRHLAKYLQPILSKKTQQRADRSTTFRAHACVALARAASKTVPAMRANCIGQLVELCSNREEPIHMRTAAAIALGEVASAGEAVEDVDARKMILSLAKRGQPLERRFAWIAAASTMTRPGAGESPLAGAGELKEALTSELAKGRAGELGWAALALGWVEDSIHERGIETPDSAGNALSAMGVKKRNDDDSAALGLGLALATRHTDRAQKTGERLLRELKQTTTPELRGNLLLALGLTEYEGAADVFRKELEGARNQPVLLWSAAIGLGLLGEPVSVDLVRMLGEAKTSEELIGISAALGQVGASNAVRPLLSLLDEDKRPAPMRAAAVEALGAICDLDRMPWRDPIAHALPYFATTATLSTNGLGLLERPW